MNKKSIFISLLLIQSIIPNAFATSARTKGDTSTESNIAAKAFDSPGEDRNNFLSEEKHYNNNKREVIKGKRKSLKTATATTQERNSIKNSKRRVLHKGKDKIASDLQLGGRGIDDRTIDDRTITNEGYDGDKKIKKNKNNVLIDGRKKENDEDDYIEVTGNNGEARDQDDVLYNVFCNILNLDIPGCNVAAGSSTTVNTRAPTRAPTARPTSVDNKEDIIINNNGQEPSDALYDVFCNTLHLDIPACSTTAESPVANNNGGTFELIEPAPASGETEIPPDVLYDYLCNQLKMDLPSCGATPMPSAPPTKPPTTPPTTPPRVDENKEEIDDENNIFEDMLDTLLCDVIKLDLPFICGKFSILDTMDINIPNPKDIDLEKSLEFLLCGVFDFNLPRVCNIDLDAEEREPTKAPTKAPKDDPRQMFNFFLCTLLPDLDMCK